MNLQQLEYIVAVDAHKSFVKAAEKCFITQATLSMMIKKLEEELDVKIFNRSSYPIKTTELGEKIIAQSKLILHEVQSLNELAFEERQGIKGELRLGIIPTLAPYLLPMFLNGFLKKYPKVRLQVHELTTEEIISKLSQQKLDAALLATPVFHKDVSSEPLFYEEFLVYSVIKEKATQKKYLLPADLDVNRLWLLEEGHCMRSQVINLCELKSREKQTHQLDFTTGSLETLIRIVEMNQGITILPALALHTMTAKQKKNIRQFKSPVPVREIGLLRNKHHAKTMLLQALKEEILLCIPAEMKKQGKKDIVEL